MRYQGSKLLEADALADVLQAIVELSGAPRYEELFCGSAAVSREMFRRGVRVDAIGDARPALIACYRALRDGTWTPPASLSVEEYKAIRAAHPDDTTLEPLAAFALIFCSHGGSWGGGYIHEDTRWSGEQSGGASRFAAAKAHRDLLEMLPFLRRCGSIWCGDYRDRDDDRPPGSVIFADPPYKGTKPYKGRGRFDHEAFWRWAAATSRRHFLVVTEDTVPDDWRTAAEVRVSSPHMREAGRLERGWVMVDGLADQLMRAHPLRAAFSLGRPQAELFPGGYH